MGFGVVFPAERGELEPFACIRDWVGRGNATRPNAGRAASTGRFGLAEPGPSRKSSPGEATPPAESVMLHFPSAPGPAAPHPPSGSRGCESWARALGGRGGGGATPALPPLPPHPGQPFPSHTHHAPAQSQRQTGPRLLGVTPPHCADAPGPAWPQQRQRPKGGDTSAPTTPKRGRNHGWRLPCPKAGASTPGTGKCHTGVTVQAGVGGRGGRVTC